MFGESVERLIRFARGNFLAGRDFTDITAPDEDAALWCAEQAGRWRRAVACVPAEEHEAACRASARELEVTEEVALWLCPRRRITFDGFAGYEGRRFGVPRWHERRDCRVGREGGYPRMYGDDLSRELVAHAAAWDRRDPWREGRRADARPEGLPGQPATTSVAQAEPSPGKPASTRSGFGRWAWRRGEGSPHALAGEAAAGPGPRPTAAEVAAPASDHDMGDAGPGAPAATLDCLAEKGGGRRQGRRRGSPGCRGGSPRPSAGSTSRGCGAATRGPWRGCPRPPTPTRTAT